MAGTITFGSCFSGVGGLDLGLERAGMRCVWQIEKHPFRKKVLSLRFPDVPQWSDIEYVTSNNLVRPHVVAGGFPCQNTSRAGDRSGLDGDRSRHWWDMHRIIRELRPHFAIVENVAGLLDVGAMPAIVGSLAEIGFDAEWESIPAGAFNAPHERDRTFIVAYSAGLGLPVGEGVFPRRKNADTAIAAHPQWDSESGVVRMAHGIPNRVDRIKALGDAVVPQVAEYIGSLVVAAYRRWEALGYV